MGGGQDIGILRVCMSAFPGTWKRGSGGFKTSSSKKSPVRVVRELSKGPVEPLVAASPISLVLFSGAGRAGVEE